MSSTFSSVLSTWHVYFILDKKNYSTPFYLLLSWISYLFLMYKAFNSLF